MAERRKVDEGGGHSSGVAQVQESLQSSSSVPVAISETSLLGEGVTVRTLRRDEMPTVCRMLYSQWPLMPSFDFHCALFDAYPDSWICATVGQTIVGVTFCATFPNESGFGGYLLVTEEYRNKGVGGRLRDTCLARFVGSNFGINAMEHRVQSNIRSGYPVSSFHIHSYFADDLDPGAAAARLDELLRQPNLLGSNGDDDAVSLAEMRQTSEELLRYDAEVNTVRRDKFLHLYIALPETYTLVAHHRDGSLVGYGTLHRGVQCYHLEPLYANDEHVAALIFFSLLSRVQHGEKLLYAAPVGNGSSVRLAESVGMHHNLTMVRMYTGCEVQLPLKKIYSISTRNASFG